MERRRSKAPLFSKTCASSSGCRAREGAFQRPRARKEGGRGGRTPSRAPAAGRTGPGPAAPAAVRHRGRASNALARPSAGLARAAA